LLIERQIEKENRQHPQDSKDINAIRFAICREVTTQYTSESTITNDEERQNRILKVVSGEIAYIADVKCPKSV
jgi:hypothetical protein